MKTAFTATILLAFAASTSIAAPAKTAAPKTAKTTAATSAIAAPAASETVTAADIPSGTTATSATAIKPEGAKKWGGVLAIWPTMSAAEANRGAEGTISAANFLDLSYKLAPKTSLSLRQYLSHDFKTDGSEQADFKFGNQRLSISNPIGKTGTGDDIVGVARYTLPTSEKSQDENHNGSLRFDVYGTFAKSGKLDVGYEALYQTAYYSDLAGAANKRNRYEHVFLQDVNFTYPLSKTINAIQYFGQESTNIKSSGKVDKFYLETAMEANVTEKVALRVSAEQYTGEPAANMTWMNEDETTYNLLGTVAF